METMTDTIRTNSTGGSGASRSGNSASSPAVIAIMGILGTAFLLVTYYAMVAKLCGRGPTRGSMRRSWRAAGRRRIGRLNEEAMGLQEEAAAQEQGLEQADIEAIPVVEFLKRGRSKKLSSCGGGGVPLDCAVCLSEFEEAERVRLLPSCCHAFHLHCIDEWLRSHATCPLCRTPICLAAAAPSAFLSVPNPTTGTPISPASAHTSPATTPPPLRQTPISAAGGEDDGLQTDTSDWPLMAAATSGKSLGEAEREAQLWRKGACRSRMRMRSPKLLQLLTHSSTYDDEHDGDIESNHISGRLRTPFPFTRCFSYTAGGRSSPEFLISSSTDDAAACTQCLRHPMDVGVAHNHSTLSSPKHMGMMQRSRSYSVGSSLFPIVSTRQLPADQRSTATASSKLWGSSTRISACAAAAPLTVRSSFASSSASNFFWRTASAAASQHAICQADHTHNQQRTP